MAKIWLISDTHFGHTNVIKYCNRPFESSDEMDKTIIENWNNTIKKYDKVFLLGDVSFHTKERTKEIIQSLNGYKVLIKGNHDKRSNDFWLDCGFKEVGKYPIILNVNDRDLILSHQPISVSVDKGDFFNYHGHVHNMINDYEVVYPNRYKCVSVENISYKPFRLA